MAYSDRYFSLAGALQEYYPRSDILHSFQLSLLTVWIPEAHSESIRMNRRPSHRHLSNTERGQNRPCKPMRHAFLTGKQKPTGIYTPPDTRLSTDLQTCRKPTIHDSEPDANICNRGCKYLQVRLQTFASADANICDGRCKYVRWRLQVRASEKAATTQNRSLFPMQNHSFAFPCCCFPFENLL